MSACVFMCFSDPLFIACFAVWDVFGSCFVRHLESRGPWKIMPKCTTICIFRVWALLERSLFPDPLLEQVLHAFEQLCVPIGAPIGSLWAFVSASGGYLCGM